MTKAEKEKRIVAIQTNLHCTREEAEQVFADDCEVDKMTMSQLNAEMTEEQRKAQKSATKTGTKKPTVYKFDTSKKTAKKMTKRKILSENCTKLCQNLRKIAKLPTQIVKLPLI